MPAAPPFMLTTGPVTAYPAVLNAMARPAIYDGHLAFQHFYRSVIGKLQKALRLSNLPLILQGDALLGLEAAAASLIGRRDVVLNLVSGVYGKGYAGWARRYGSEVIELEVPFDEAITPELVSEALAARPDISIRLPARSIRSRRSGGSRAGMAPTSSPMQSPPSAALTCIPRRPTSIFS
jgi:pyridoxamine---pyruvate transaminase